MQMRPRSSRHAGRGEPVGAQLAGISPAAGPWRMVTVAAPGGSANAGTTLRVPAVECATSSIRSGRGACRSAIPDDVMRRWPARGTRSSSIAELVPVPLEDGRQLVMPVDQVKVHYVGNGETY